MKTSSLSAVALSCALTVLGVTDVSGQTADDTNNNGLPDVCNTDGNSYSIALISVDPRPDGSYDFTYSLTPISDAALKKISRVVFAFERPLVPADIKNPAPPQLSDYCVEDAPSKAGRGTCGTFEGYISPKPGPSLTIPFSITSATNKRGLITVNVDTGTGGLFTCKSRRGSAGDLTDQGPMGIEGPGGDINPLQVTAVSTIIATPNDLCPAEVRKDARNKISEIVLAPGADPGCTIEVVDVLTADGITVNSVGGSGGEPVVLHSGENSCKRIWDGNKWTYIDAPGAPSC